MTTTVLLTTLRKTLSLITLHRISDKVNDFHSPPQRGFRRGRSTADVVWGHRWLVAKCHRYKYVIEIPGIDLPRAFDIICGKKLLDALHSFLDPDNVRIIRLLLSETKIECLPRRPQLTQRDNIGTRYRLHLNRP
ncbi:hypothetical protein LSAT2_022558 [Lamellibrachia satsuma]|nr:hypothetical protein LSAT2_022558 [Lamellibrachia satsuma]